VEHFRARVAAKKVPCCVAHFAKIVVAVVVGALAVIVAVVVAISRQHLPPSCGRAFRTFDRSATVGQQHFHLGEVMCHVIEVRGRRCFFFDIGSAIVVLRLVVVVIVVVFLAIVVKKILHV
jgi:hypothetical protein